MPSPVLRDLAILWATAAIAFTACGDGADGTGPPGVEDLDDAGPGETPPKDHATEGGAPDGGELPVPTVDATTLIGKTMFGYQGWHAAPGDGSPSDRWWHWFSTPTSSATTLAVDMWPDTRELDPSELFPTTLKMADGSPAKLYSSWTEATVVRHFRWMREAGIDGVMLQRFPWDLEDPGFRALRDQVTRHVMKGAALHGRTFTIMYDITGMPEATLVAKIQSDWQGLVDAIGVTASDRYLHHRGKPLVAVWGLGLSTHPGTAAQAQALIDWFHTGAPAKYQASVMGGLCVPWRLLGSGCKTEPEWSAVYRSFDVISPWSIGYFSTDAAANAFKGNAVVPDLKETTARGIDYMPVIWPGFSWANKVGGALNQIPRRGGSFFWRQAYNVASTGAKMQYVAMFDEVDEGTAMYKIAENAAQAPSQGNWVTLDADSVTLPSDWYLRLGGAATKMLRGEIPLTPTIPMTP